MTDLLDRVAEKHRCRPSSGIPPLRATPNGASHVADDGRQATVSSGWSYAHAGVCWDRPAFRNAASSWVRSSVGWNDKPALDATLSSACYRGIRPGEQPSENWKRSGALQLPPDQRQLYDGALKSLPYVGIMTNDGSLQRMEFDGGVQLGRSSVKKWGQVQGELLMR